MARSLRSTLSFVLTVHTQPSLVEEVFHHLIIYISSLSAAAAKTQKSRAKKRLRRVNQSPLWRAAAKVAVCGPTVSAKRDSNGGAAISSLSARTGRGASKKTKIDVGPSHGLSH